MHNIEDMYKNYARLVYKYILCLSNNSSIAEDITQDTFLVATQKINTFNNKCKVSTWLCQIAKFLYYKKIRKEKNYSFTSIENLDNYIFSIDCIEEKIINNEEKKEILKSIQKLDSQTQAVMHLRLLGNLEYNEIAEILNRTPSWCRTIFFRGKEKIKEDQNEKRM